VLFLPRDCLLVVVCRSLLAVFGVRVFPALGLAGLFRMPASLMSSRAIFARRPLSRTMCFPGGFHWLLRLNSSS
jgi:hypothetical protein